MLKNANYIDNNIIITDEINTKKLGKKAQVGFDLSVKSISYFNTPGIVLKDKTYASETTPLEKQSFKDCKGVDHIGWFLPKGTYGLTLNEGCKFGPNDTGLIILRSSLNRSGVQIHSAVWDPGYTTKDETGIHPMNIRLSVENPNGFYLEENSRVAQLLIFENEDTDLYNGQWQGGQTTSNLV